MPTTFDLWMELFEFLVVLAAAFSLGALAERFRQSALVGYLLAGVILGPLLFQKNTILSIADLGVALLLFSIGLEFSVARLKQLGTVALAGGAGQVVLTTVLFALPFVWLRSMPQAFVLGTVAALSSTTVVMRLLKDRAEIDSVSGRYAVGILLFQDLAVVPLVLLIALFGGGGAGHAVWRQIGGQLLGLGGLLVVFHVLFNLVAPRLLFTIGTRGNRELIHLLTFLTATGSAWFAHLLGLSAGLGAFLAGMLLGGSPFAAQARADIGPVRTLFVTLFFTSIGMLADVRWIVTHLPILLLALAAVIVGKTAVTYLVLRLLRRRRRHALATGLSLAQIGEFSFVLATTGAVHGLVDDSTLAFVSSTTLLSLLVAPYLIAHSRAAADRLAQLWPRFDAPDAATLEVAPGPPCDIVLIGFGPAGKQIAAALKERGACLTVIEQNPQTARDASAMGVTVHIGDARQPEILAHAGVNQARVVMITVPDPRNARLILEVVRRLAPQATRIVRARYSQLKDQLEQAGATVVVDEETQVGARLADEAITALGLDG